MNKLFLILPILLLAQNWLVLHSGNSTSGLLLNINDKYVDIAIGKSKSVFVIGLGNLKKSELILDVRKKMMLNKSLQKNQYYANSTSDISKKFILGFLVVQTEVTISADIMLFNDTLSKNPFTSHYLKLNRNEITTPPIAIITQTFVGNSPKTNSTSTLLMNGDSIFYATDKKNFKLYTVSSLDNETVILRATNEKDKNILTSKSAEFYFKNFSINDFKNGVEVSFQITDALNHPVTEIGKVVGVSNKNVLILTQLGYTSLPTIKITKIN